MMIHAEFSDLQEVEDFAEFIGFRRGTASNSTQSGEGAAPTQMLPSAPPNQDPPVQVPPPTPMNTPTGSAEAPASVTLVPTTPTTYSLDDLAAAAMTLMDSGRQGDLLGVLQSFGVEALPALPQSQYGAFATALRGLGARI